MGAEPTLDRFALSAEPSLARSLGLSRREWDPGAAHLDAPRGRVRTVFLDRDGVINVNRSDHVKSWEEFEFLPGAVEAIVRLSHARVRVFVITNQAIINRGMVPHYVVEWINERMQRVIAQHGGHITAVAYCPHRPEERCRCRKPEPGLLFDLARSHMVELHSSVMIGDAVSDLEAGQAAGCSTILVLTGRGRDQLELAHAQGKNGFVVAEDLGAAAELMLQRTWANVCKGETR